MPIKAVLFDFMGTCLDWHSSIISILPQELTESTRSHFALRWRQTYFDSNAARLRAGQPPEDIDVTLRNTLDAMLDKPEHADIRGLFSEDVKRRAVMQWHKQPAWDDVAPALQRLRERGWEVFVHANGTTRLQLDLVKFSGLEFDMLFSSQMLGVYKPAPENYLKVLELIKLRSEEVVLVAAHAYDLRGAKALGWKTVYVYRWTDDVDEDQEIIKNENDAYLYDMSQLDETIAKLDV